MIGFDRPLKPQWIYETLKMLIPGTTLQSYHEPFENLIKELVGAEGKRKVRTIIFRSFVYSFQEERSILQNNLFIEWSRKYSLEHLKPLFLSKILMDHDITRFIIRKMESSFDQSKQLSSTILTRKMVQEYGDRDVVKRSVRSFLKALVNFQVLEQIALQDYRLLPKLKLSNEQIKQFLLLYSLSFLKSKVIDLLHIEPTLLYFFNEIDFVGVAREYHGREWEFVRDVNRNLVLVK